MNNTKCGYDIYRVVLADMLAAPQKSYGQQDYFQILSVFSYDNFVSQPMADTIWWHVFN